MEKMCWHIKYHGIRFVIHLRSLHRLRLPLVVNKIARPSNCWLLVSCCFSLAIGPCDMCLITPHDSDREASMVK